MHDSRELGLSSGYLQMLVQQSLLLTSYDVLISGNLSARALTLTGGCGSYSILLGLRGDVHQSTNQIVYGKEICTYTCMITVPISTLHTVAGISF